MHNAVLHAVNTTYNISLYKLKHKQKQQSHVQIIRLQHQLKENGTCS